MKHYRYESRRYSSVIDAEREIYGVTRPKLELQEYEVEKETPCGYWIRRKVGSFSGIDRRWVSKTSRKRYAYPSKQEALEGFLARKKRYALILSSKLKEAKEDIALAEAELNKVLTAA